jgi:hypothetical protein
MNWKSFAAGLILGTSLMWIFLSAVGFWSIHVSGSQIIRFNKITGKTEAFSGERWLELKNR